MAFRISCVALLLSSLPIAGCGTVANLVKSDEAGGKAPFGGITHDVSSIKQAQAVNGDCCCMPCCTAQQYRQVALGVLCALDLPFTVIGDVLTWPYAASYTYINQPVPVPPMKPAPPPPAQQGSNPARTQAPTPPTQPAPTPPAPQTTPDGRPQTPP